MKCHSASDCSYIVGSTEGSHGANQDGSWSVQTTRVLAENRMGSSLRGWSDRCGVESEAGAGQKRRGRKQAQAGGAAAHKAQGPQRAAQRRGRGRRRGGAGDGNAAGERGEQGEERGRSKTAQEGAANTAT